MIQIPKRNNRKRLRKISNIPRRANLIYRNKATNIRLKKIEEAEEYLKKLKNET